MSPLYAHPFRRRTTSVVADPAVGVGTKIITPPAGKGWILLSGHWHLESDANLPTRSVVISFQDAAGEPFGPTGPNYLQHGNFTSSFCLHAGIPTGDLTGNNDNVHHAVPIPVGGGLPIGGAMIIVVTGIQAADELRDIVLFAEEEVW